jgi:hypothetical protein
MKIKYQIQRVVKTKTKISFLFIILLLLLNVSNDYSQSFTKITDPNNPVVTDMNQSTGGCWIDFNNDGFLDLFVSNGNLSSQNNALYLNNRSGGFIKITTGAIVNDGGTSIGGTWGDYNNDGNLDLFVANRNNFGNFLYMGHGDTTFTKITTGNIVTDLGNSNSGAWVDITRDGYLDMHVVNFTQNDFLYMNNGSPNFTFTKIDTAAFLLDGSGTSIIGAWADYNNDRLPDLFIGNAGTNNFLWKNNGNLFFTRTIISNTRNTIGASWGDYDNDGNLDLFVANYLNNKNILYHNSGPPNYDLIPIDTGIVSNDPGNCVGSCWGDFNNDGYLDLFVTNDGNANFLYMNNGPPNYGFTKVTTGIIVTDVANSFGCVCGDYDNDGQLDVFVATRTGQGNLLYHNNGNSNKWITVKCVGVISNKAAIGTKVRLKSTINGLPTWQTQEIMPHTGYNSQNLWLHFGLGNASIIDSIRVEWINGATNVFTNVSVNQGVTIIENGPLISVTNNSSKTPEKFTLHQNYPNPFNPMTKIKFELPKSSDIKIQIFDITGRVIDNLIDANLGIGSYEVQWDGSKVSSGIYFYRLQSKSFMDTKKMILIK